jgi:predicted enzyme related to lactoylglutathione lyase
MSLPAGPRPTRLGQIAINVKDLQRAVRFYRDVLGIDYLFEILQSAFFRIGEVRLMMGVAEKPEFDHPASILYYLVPDINEAYEAMRGRGAEFEDVPHLIAKMPDHELWMCFLRDTEGNMLALMSEVR